MKGLNNNPTNYKEALEVLNGRKYRKLENNTYLETRSGDQIAVRLHGTDVVKYFADGSVVLNTGGWNTVTTKDRLNKYSAARVYQKNYDWFVEYGGRVTVWIEPDFILEVRS